MKLELTDEEKVTIRLNLLAYYITIDGIEIVVQKYIPSNHKVVEVVKANR